MTTAALNPMPTFPHEKIDIKESNLKQFEDVDAINLKRRIEKDKGSRYFINEKKYNSCFS